MAQIDERFTPLIPGRLSDDDIQKYENYTYRGLGYTLYFLHSKEQKENWIYAHPTKESFEVLEELRQLSFINGSEIAPFTPYLMRGHPIDEIYCSMISCLEEFIDSILDERISELEEHLVNSKILLDSIELQKRGVANIRVFPSIIRIERALTKLGLNEDDLIVLIQNRTKGTHTKRDILALLKTLRRLEKGFKDEVNKG